MCIDPIRAGYERDRFPEIAMEAAVDDTVENVRGDRRLLRRGAFSRLSQYQLEAGLTASNTSTNRLFSSNVSKDA